MLVNGKVLVSTDHSTVAHYINNRGSTDSSQLLDRTFQFYQLVDSVKRITKFITFQACWQSFTWALSFDEITTSSHAVPEDLSIIDFQHQLPNSLNPRSFGTMMLCNIKGRTSCLHIATSSNGTQNSKEPEGVAYNQSGFGHAVLTQSTLLPKTRKAHGIFRLGASSFRKTTHQSAHPAPTLFALQVMCIYKRAAMTRGISIWTTQAIVKARHNSSGVLKGMNASV